MNLWFRLIAYLFTIPWRRSAPAPGEFRVLYFRAWPSDLDLSNHVNNGKYLSLMDIGRLDFVVATGLWKAILKHRWTPIASNILVRYRREIRLFRRFRLQTRLVTWDDSYVVMEQVFVFVGGKRNGQVAARALFKGGIYDRKARAFVSIDRLMREIGVNEVAPEASPEVEAFLVADDVLRGRAG